MEQKPYVMSEEGICCFGEYLYENEYAEGTIRKYLTDIRQFRDFLGDRRSVDKKRLVDYKKWLEVRYAPRSVNSMLTALNRFFSFAEREDLRLKSIKVQQQVFARQEKYLTREEYVRLVKTARGQKKEQLAILMETIGSTGSSCCRSSCGRRFWYMPGRPAFLRGRYSVPEAEGRETEAISGER